MKQYPFLSFSQRAMFLYDDYEEGLEREEKGKDLDWSHREVMYSCLQPMMEGEREPLCRATFVRPSGTEAVWCEWNNEMSLVSHPVSEKIEVRWQRKRVREEVDVVTNNSGSGKRNGL